MTEKDIQLDINNLRSLYPRSVVSFAHKMTIQQTVSFAFEYTQHKYMRLGTEEGKVFGAYLTLLKTEPDDMGNTIAELEKFVDEEVVEECLRYIRTGVVPYHILGKKLIKDLKADAEPYYLETSKPSMLYVYLLKIMRCSFMGYNKIHKMLMEEIDSFSDEIADAIHSAYAWYLSYPQSLKEEYVKAFNTKVEETRRKFVDNELSLFSEILSDTMGQPLIKEFINDVENGIKPAFYPIWLDPSLMEMQMVDVTPAVTNEATETQTVADGDVITEVPYNVQNKDAISHRNTSYIGAFYVKVLGWTVDGKTPEDVVNEMKLMQMASDGSDLSDEELEKRAKRMYGMVEAQDEHAKYQESEEAKAHKEALKEVDITKVPKRAPLYKDEEVKPVRTHEISNVATRYCVLKVAKNMSHRVMSKRWFDTLQEAEEFREAIVKDNPEIAKNFDFKIEEVY